MIPPKHTLPLNGLRAIHNSRTRIFAAGRDPLFGRTTAPRDWFAEAGANRKSTEPRLLRRDWLDRLQPSVTRRHE